MKILLITNLFHPEPNYLKGLEFAKELRRRGHYVHVLTGFPSYPGGKLYSGYRMSWTLREEVEGVPITRVAMYPSHDTSALRRILSFISVGLSQALHSLSRERFDVCHVYLGPITLMWPAVMRRWLGRARLVADVQDLWPESVTDSGMLPSKLAGRVLNRWCRWAYESADRIAVLSPGYRAALAGRGVDPARIDVVYNWCDERSVAAAGTPPEGILEPGAFNVVYAGNMGRLQGIDTVLDAAKEIAALAPSVRFALVGDGVEAERLRRRVADERISNVRFHARLRLEQTNALQRAADLLLVHLVSTPLTRIGIPSKVQSYLACGVPVLAAAEGDTADLVERSGGGYTCRPNDAHELASAIRRAFATPAQARATLGDNARRFYERELSFKRGVDRLEALFEAARGPTGSGAPLAPASRRVALRLKRVIDVLASTFGLSIGAPVLVCVALAIRLCMGTPVMFTQRRPGLRGAPFLLFKFRTMRDARDATGRSLSDEERLTALGRFLRATSLDELPQLWNVLRGDLSLVGPRPLLMQYLPRYNHQQARRHEVKPGITGWAQVNGRNAITWEEKFALDVWYVDHWTIWLDFKILALTALRVVRRDGISRHGHATMPEFLGNESSNGAKAQWEKSGS